MLKAHVFSRQALAKAATARHRSVRPFWQNLSDQPNRLFLTDREKLVNLVMLGNRLGSPRVTLGGSFFLLWLRVLPLLLICSVHLSRF